MTKPFTTFHQLDTITGLNKLLGCVEPLSAPLWGDFSGSHILRCKKEKLINLQISSQVDKAMKKLQWIPNTIANTSVLVIFLCLHIWRGQNWFIYSGIEKQLIVCIRTDQRYYWALKISKMEFFGKNVQMRSYFWSVFSCF